LSRTGSPEATSRRIDQWLWFARLAKSRSLASCLCAAGAITLNGVVVRKSRHLIRVGDFIAVPQGALCRIVRVAALGSRRGPSAEARSLYEETATLTGTGERDLPWEPLLEDDQPASNLTSGDKYRPK